MAAGALAGAIAGNAVDQRVTECRQRAQASREQTYANPEDQAPPGEWVVVPGRWVEGKWVPSHRVWVPVNP
jgi:outer membrane lipoprotein SlyB